MSETPPGSGLREHALIASRFLRSPNTVGAIAASSRYLARMMVERIPADRPVHVVELGPGTGAFTAALVERVARGSRILAIELEPAFVDLVRQKLPSIDIVLASAVDLEQLVGERRLAPIDHFVSGLPFASLPVDMTTQILDGIEHVLRPGGTFTTFQYLHGYGLKAGRSFRQEMSRRMGGPPIRRLAIKNFPLAFVLSWTRLR